MLKRLRKLKLSASVPANQMNVVAEPNNKPKAMSVDPVKFLNFVLEESQPKPTISSPIHMMIGCGAALSICPRNIMRLELPLKNSFNLSP
ncbi:MAG: hypothetical protein QXP47_02075 [Candidatus Nezhaarchaeales archaeon]